MALAHAQPLDLIDLRPLGAKLTPTRSHSLLRTDRLQLMRIVLMAGQGLPLHRQAGEILFHGIEGVVRIRTSAGDKLLLPGDAVLLPSGEPHALLATQDASLLAVMLLAPHRAQPQSGNSPA